MRETVHVDLEDRSYDILIGDGLLAEAGQLIAPFLKRSRVVIVSDENVAALHLKTLEASLGSAGIDHAADALVVTIIVNCRDVLAKWIYKERFHIFTL